MSSNHSANMMSKYVGIYSQILVRKESVMSENINYNKLSVPAVRELLKCHPLRQVVRHFERLGYPMDEIRKKVVGVEKKLEEGTVQEQAWATLTPPIFDMAQWRASHHTVGDIDVLSRQPIQSIHHPFMLCHHHT